MAYFEQEINEYKIIHWSNYGTERARIECYLDGGMVGIIHFNQQGGAPPTIVNRVIHLKLDAGEFSDIITTLRYEKPIFMFFNDTDATAFGGIKTSSHEPVGEEES